MKMIDRKISATGSATGSGRGNAPSYPLLEVVDSITLGSSSPSQSQSPSPNTRSRDRDR